ncbi:hypothetical protein, partial [Enterobacter hormaechei]|uniref:hypothetical protein n=1 Tax=Enterobacter hormaechei TaxID=158836 RepID=UPI001BD4A677
ASHQCSIFSAYLILLICPVKNGGITITFTVNMLLLLLLLGIKKAAHWQPFDVRDVTYEV